MSSIPSISRTPSHILQSAWKRIAPLELADTTWDNVGMMFEAPYPKSTSRKILLTIDLTSEVCKEALELNGCSLVVAYHPPIFSSLKSVTLSSPIQSSLLHLVASGISIFSPHTSLDSVNGGINDWLAKPFSTSSSITPIIPSTIPHEDITGSHLYENAGMGRIVRFENGMGLEVGEIVKRVKSHLGIQYVQLASPATNNPSTKINSIAICAGSGGSIFKGVDADLYLTGEMSHHELLALTAQSKHIILTSHSNSERPYLSHVLKERLEKEMKEESGDDWAVCVSERDRDPLVVV